jgi:hypothetical protein
VEIYTDAPHAQDLAAALADDVLFDARQAALAAITSELSSSALRNHIARVIRDKLAALELDIAAQYHRSDDD